MSEKKITGFFDTLADDADKEYLFGQEPVAVMTEFGLSDDQQALLLKGSISEIRAAVQAEGDSAAIVIIKIKMK